MSLISDALRKARQEAAEREAGDRGMERPVVAGYWARSRRPVVSLVLGIAGALGAAVLGGAVVWWALSSRPDVTEVKVRQEATVETVPDRPPVVEQRPEQPGENDPSVVVSVDLVPDDGPPVIGEVDGSVGTTAPKVREGLPERLSMEGTPGSSERLHDESGGEFVAEAHVGDVTLTLDYLVYREDSPFAQINGRDVRVGAVIEGFVVDAITANSVVLIRDETRVEIRVR